MVDQEGIRFVLETEFKSQAQLDAFLKQIREARRELAALTRAQRRAASSRATSRATGQGQPQRTTRSVKQQNKFLKESITLTKELTEATAKLTKEARVGAAAEIKRARALERSGFAARALAGATSAAASEQARAAGATVRTTNAVKQQTTQWSRLVGTIRGVVTGLVVYRGLTRGLDLLTGQIAQAVRFGSELEVAENAISGLILGSSQLVDENDKLVQGAERFTAGVSLARRELEGLRKQALGTSATFQQLVTNYQLNVAQGLGAGLSLDEFRDIALQFSQAGTLLGVPQNQLAEEIRSVLQGTIRSRDTRIAVALGITNDDIRRVKETGELVDFLEEKFEGIREASEALRGTLPVIFSDLQDALEFAGREGASGLRQDLVEIGETLRSSLVSPDGDISQDLVEGYRRAFRPLRGIVKDISSLFDSIGPSVVAFTEALLSSLEVLTSLARLLEPVGVFVTEFFSGLSIAFQFISQILRALSNGLRAVFGLLGGAGQEIEDLFRGLARFAGAAAGIFLFVKAFAALKVAMGAVTIASGLLSKALKGVGISSTLALGPVGVAFAVVLGLALAIDELVKSSEQAQANLEILFGTQAAENRKRIKLLKQEVMALELALYNLENFETPEEQLGVPMRLEMTTGRELVNTAESVRAALADANAELALLESTFESPFSEGVLGAVGEKFGSAVEEAITGTFDRIQGLLDLSKVFALDDVADKFQLSGEVQSARLEFAKLGSAQGKVADLAQVALDLTEQRTEAIRANRKALDDLAPAFLQAAAGSAQEAALLEQRDALQADLNAVNREYTEELKRQADLLLAGNEAVDTRLQIENEILEARAGIDFSAGFAQDAEQAVDLYGQALTITQELQEVVDQRDSIQRQANFAREFANLLGGDEVLLAQIDLLEANRLATIKDQVQNLQLRAKLIQQEARQVAQRTTFRGGLEAGISGEREQLQTGVLTQQVTQQTISTIRQGIRSGVAIAFDPTQNLDLGEGLKLIGTQIGVDIATALIENLILEPILDFFQGLLGDGGQAANLAAEQAALSKVTNALTGEFAALLATISAGSAVAPVAGAAAVAGPGSVSPGGKYFGGPVGFNEGGAVPLTAPKLASSPPGVHAADRIPALLRRGEYVATPEMNQRVPGLFSALESIRRGVHTSIPNFRTLRKPRGFAAGGAADGSTVAAGALGRRGGTEVLPVLVTDERNLKRIHDNPQFVAGAQRRTNRSVFRSLSQQRFR